MKIVFLRLLVVLAATTGVALFAQPRYEPEFPPTVPQWFDRGAVPDWSNDARFEKDVFTFVRVYFESYAGGRRFPHPRTRKEACCCTAADLWCTPHG